MAIDASFWQGRRVFVTGHTGFKGSWLCLWLQKMGARVTGYALAPDTQPDLFGLLHSEASSELTSLLSDVRDVVALTAALKASAPTVVFHLAAQPLVRRSYQDPVTTYATNVMGTVNMLEAVRATPSVQSVVVVTSDKCYENREWAWAYRESDTLGGYDPYSNSKACAELVLQAYRNSFFNPAQYLPFDTQAGPNQQAGQHHVALASGRAGNVIGGGDWAADRLVPDLLRAFASQQVANIRNPNAFRPWQHVLEPLSAYLQLAQALTLRGPGVGPSFNFGPKNEDCQSVGWIADKLQQLWGAGARWGGDPQAHPHEAHHLKLDCSLAQTQLHWQPVWPLDTALEKTVSWQKAWLERADMRAISLSQILEFESTVHHD